MSRWSIVSLFLLAALPIRADWASPREVASLDFGGDETSVAESVLFAALDSEALFTLAGGLKPVSSGFVTLVERSGVDSLAVRRLRGILEGFKTSHIDAFLHAIGPFPDGKTYHLATVVDRRAFREKVRQHREFFQSLEITPETPPLTALEKVNRAARNARFRGYGLLFGYPAHAVDFFVEADRREQETGVFVERESVSVPVHGAAVGHFVWVVPVGHRKIAEEQAIEDAASLMLERYRRLRRRHAGTEGLNARSIANELREPYEERMGNCAGLLERLGAVSEHAPLTQRPLSGQGVGRVWGQQVYLRQRKL